MNKNKLKGRINDAVGKTRHATGRAVGNEKLQAKGDAQVSKGKTQVAIGDFTDDASDAVDKVKKAFDA